MRARGAAVGLAKPLEHVRQHVRGDALPGVAHHDLDVRVEAGGANLHATVARRELHRVRNQVPHDLLQPIAIAHDRADARAEHRLHVDVLARGRRPNGVDAALDDRRQIHRADVEADLAGDNARDVQEVFDEPDLRHGVPFDGFQSFHHHGGIDVLVTQRARPAEHGVQRRAQLVRERREEFVLDPVRVLGLLAGGALVLEQARALGGQAPGLRLALAQPDLPRAQTLGGRVECPRHLGDLGDRRGECRRRLFAALQGRGGLRERGDRLRDPSTEHQRERHRERRHQRRARRHRQRRPAKLALDVLHRNSGGHRPARNGRAAVRGVEPLALEPHIPIGGFGRLARLRVQDRRDAAADPALGIERSRDDEAVLVEQRHGGAGNDGNARDEPKPDRRVEC